VALQSRGVLSSTWKTEAIFVNTKKSPIEHLLVLMLENRSYDHMLGYFQKGDGLTGGEYNLANPADPESEKVYVSNTSGYITLPNPDGKVSLDPPFDFTRLGLRVLALLISPWVDKGQVDSTLYEHASIPATVRALFNLPEALTARDQAANTFDRNIRHRTPRTDAPTLLPVPGDVDVIKPLRQLLHVDAHERVLQESSTMGRSHMHP
jgi:phospholipase C